MRIVSLGVLFFSFLLTAQMSWADPSCSKLNELWPKYHADLKTKSWDVNGFGCPSEKSRITNAMYYLDTMDIINLDGKEIFDYYDYVVSGIYKTYRDERSPNFATTDNYLYLGSSLYATHDSSGQPRPSNSLKGAEMLVHERKHMDLDTPIHVSCNDSDLAKSCDEQYYSIIDGEARIDDDHVGAYSISVAYIIDVYQNAFNHDLSKSAFRILLQSRLTNNFKPSGITNKQVTDALKKVDAL